MAPLAAIFTCAGPELSEAERAFFREVDPLGFILFAVNIETPDQVRALTAELRACVGRADAPVLIDQEGGRVARLRPPHWREAPPARVFGDLYLLDRARALSAARLNARLLAAELSGLGINVDCAPVLDLSIPGAHDVIGDRSFGGDPDLVADLGRAFAEELAASGVIPMIKHLPGHGRAMADSHHELPTVDIPRAELEETDFAPFRLLHDMPMAMTAHILYPGIDPERPATTSPTVVGEIIRGLMGFDGLLVSDDLTMSALIGSDEEKAHRTRSAGCDVVLHCVADLDGMQGVARGCGRMSEEGKTRLARALGMVRRTPERIDMGAGEKELAALLEPAGT